MNFWPFRSRPVVTPFTDDFSGRVLSYPGAFNAQTVDLIIPDNIYCIPTALHLLCHTGAGIRGFTNNSVYFIRGGVTFASSVGIVLPSNRIAHLTYQTFQGWRPITLPIDNLISYLPHPLYLYPNDVVRHYFAEFQAADVFDEFSIHGQFWEVH